MKLKFKNYKRMFEPNVILYSLWQYIDHYILCMAIHMFYGNTLTTIYLIIFVYRPFWYPLLVDPFAG